MPRWEGGLGSGGSGPRVAPAALWAGSRALPVKSFWLLEWGADGASIESQHVPLRIAAVPLIGFAKGSTGGNFFFRRSERGSPSLMMSGLDAATTARVAVILSYAQLF